MHINLFHKESFANRHNGSDEIQIQQMLATVRVSTLDELIEQTVPHNIRLKNTLQLPEAQSEPTFLASFKKIAQKNKTFKSYIGMGYHDCHTPNVILRNILENPAWYTAYTPYQAEIAQGRLEALINFQTVVMDLTGMEIANASLLDESTAAAEAMSMLFSQRKGAKKKANTFFVSEQCFPQTIDVLKTRATPLGIQLLVGNHEEVDLTQPDIFGALLQYPAGNGEVYDYTHFISAAHELEIKVAVAADLLSLTLLTPPGEMGADVVVGSSQRFGIPMGYGGPHAAFFATKESYKRNIPGRIIGASVDTQGNPAYRMALQTREQHIRREKATSNICTAQVLLAVMAGMYATYHGPKGLRSIAERVYGMTQLLRKGLEKLGIQVNNTNYFDTLQVSVEDSEPLRATAETQEINFRYFDGKLVGISLNETTTVADIQDILTVSHLPTLLLGNQVIY